MQRHGNAHAWLIGLFAVGVLVHYGPAELPLRGDRAYFTYLGQSVLAGDAIYRVSFLAYPPLAPLLTGGAMWLGDSIGIHTVLAGRALGFALSLSRAERIRRSAVARWRGLCSDSCRRFSI